MRALTPARIFVPPSAAPFDYASPCLRLSVLPFVFLALAHFIPPVLAQSAVPGTFVIEAEDFDYGRGQTKAAASTMPYLGGAYSG